MSVDDVDESQVQAMFGYGTFRGDYDENGDRWGVIQRTRAKWQKALVRGFRLYQDRKKPFPFVVMTGREEDVLHGTLITWPGGPEDARAGITMAERFEMSCAEDGYARGVGRAFVEREDGSAADGNDEPVLAVVFHLRLPSDKLSKCHFFSSGDWMRPVPALRDTSGNVEAMFAYGRFRGDYDAGDSSLLAGAWVEALAVGFKLYKHPDEQYPFAVYTGDEEDVLHGTFILFQGTEDAVKALHTVSDIEGIDEENPQLGTYRRTVTEVSWPAVGGGHTKMGAFIYYQEWPAEHLARCEFYADGDWLREHVAK